MSARTALVGTLVQAVLLESPVVVLTDAARIGVLVERALQRHGLEVQSICDADATLALPALPPPCDDDQTQVLALLEAKS